MNFSRSMMQHLSGPTDGRMLTEQRTFSVLVASLLKKIPYATRFFFFFFSLFFSLLAIVISLWVRPVLPDVLLHWLVGNRSEIRKKDSTGVSDVLRFSALVRSWIAKVEEHSMLAFGKPYRTDPFKLLLIDRAIWWTFHLNLYFYTYHQRNKKFKRKCMFDLLKITTSILVWTQQ